MFIFLRMLVWKIRLFVGRYDSFAITIKTEWEWFYWVYFGVRPDFSKVAIPDDPNDFPQIVFILKGLTLNRVIEVLSKRFKVMFDPYYIDKGYKNRWNMDIGRSPSDHNFNSDIEADARTSDNDYAIRINGGREVDQENGCCTANELDAAGVPCVTLMEVLIYFLQYWLKNHKHLNYQTATLCAGSRLSNGRVPVVHWDLGGCAQRVRIHSMNPDYINKGVFPYGTRRVVS